MAAALVVVQSRKGTRIVEGEVSSGSDETTLAFRAVFATSLRCASSVVLSEASFASPGPYQRGQWVSGRVSTA